MPRKPHTIEILAVGAELRGAAEARCAGVNEAHFVVHEVVLETLADADAARDGRAREQMFARLDEKLDERDAGD